MPKIEILSGKREGETVELPADGIDIGNRKTAKLSIRDPWISWNHAKIIPDADGFVIEDLGSSNGTWINGKKVTRQLIVPGEEILLGKTKIRYVDGAGTRPSSTERMSESSGTTAKLARPSIVQGSSSASPAQDERMAERVSELERENNELRKMKEALERFLDLSPEERASLGSAPAAPAAPPPPPPPAARADDGATERARQEAVARLIELEGKVTAAESRAVELENRLKGSSEQSKKDLARAKEKFEEELGFARAAKTDADTAREEAESKARELTQKLETAASDVQARIDKLEKDLESARKSGIDADARVQKLERDLDKTRSMKASASGGASQAELDKAQAELTRVQGELAKASAERDDWKTKHDGVREEIDQISMDQIELEDQLRARIAELEGKK